MYFYVEDSRWISKHRIWPYVPSMDVYFFTRDIVIADEQALDALPTSAGSTGSTGKNEVFNELFRVKVKYNKNDTVEMLLASKVTTY